MSAAILGMTNNTVNDTMHTVPVSSGQEAPGCHCLHAEALVMIFKGRSLFWS